MHRKNFPQCDENTAVQDEILHPSPDDDSSPRQMMGIDLDDYLDPDFNDDEDFEDEDDAQDDDAQDDDAQDDFDDDDFDDDDFDDDDDDFDDDDDESDDDDDESDDDDDESDDDDDESDDEESDENVIVISGEDSHLSDTTFEELGLSPALMKGVRSRGYKRPTPVQASSFKLGAKGQDLVVRSKTGTGKTAAFLLPALQQLKDRERKVRTLVLTPTRELALQVADEAEQLSDYMKINVVALYGGVSLRPQIDALERGAEVVVGTPGRVLDHIRRGNLDLSTVNTSILDEADEMLSMGFYEDVTTILDHARRNSQLLLFSATIDASVSGIIKRYMTDPKEIMLSTDVRTVDGITHKLYTCSDSYPKARSLLYTLYIEQPESALIFCNTRADTNFIANYLNRQGFDTEAISSDNSQAERERVMGRIKRGELSFLVATDLASRGIDISHLSHVINYDLPQDPNTYLHRTGRTGRAGNVGTAVSLYSGRDLTIQMNLEKNLKIPFEHKDLPAPDEAARIFMDQRLIELRKAKDSTAYESYVGLAKTMIQELPEEERNNLLATALKIFFTSLRVKEKSHSVADESESSSSDNERRSPRSDRDSRSRDSRDRDRAPRRGGRSSERRERSSSSRSSRSSGDRSRGGRSEGRSDRDSDRRGGRSRNGRSDSRSSEARNGRSDSRSSEARNGRSDSRSSEARNGRSDSRNGNRRSRDEKTEDKPRSRSSSEGRSDRQDDRKRSENKRPAPRKSSESSSSSSGDINLNDWLDESGSGGGSESRPESGSDEQGNRRRRRGRRGRGGNRRPSGNGRRSSGDDS